MNGKLPILNDTMHNVKDTHTDTLKWFLKFVIQEFAGTHLIIIAERQLDISSVISHVMKSVVLSLWTSDAFKMTKNILEFCHNVGGCVIVGLQINQHAIDIMQTVNESFLESTNIQYVFLTDPNIQSDILPLLREGTRVSLFEGNLQSDTIFSCYQSVWTKDNKSKFQLLGVCQMHQFQMICDLNMKIGRSIISDYEDFHGRHIKIAANNNHVFVRCFKPTPQCGPNDWQGSDYEQISYLSKKLNFTYELVHDPNNVWGGPRVDGQITGLVGIVARHEAFMAVHEVTITEARDSVVDFVYPYYTEKSTLASRKPEIANKSFLLFAPYTAFVWCLILATVLLVSISFDLIDKANKKIRNIGRTIHHKQKFSEYLFSIFRSLIIQSYHLPPYGCSTRVLLSVWFATVIGFTGLYSGLLTGVLTAPRFEKPVDTPEDALDVFCTKNVYPAVTLEASLYYFLKSAEDGVYRDIFNKLNKEASFVSYEPRMKMVDNGELISFSSAIGHYSLEARFSMGYTYISKDGFFSQSYGIITPSGSPYRDVLSHITLQTLPFGLYNKWVEIALKHETEKILRDRNMTGIFLEKTVKPSGISLEALQTAFFMWLFGIVIATVTFILEYVKYI